MGLFGTMANWLSKYGGRNGTESSQNYNSTSYGAIGALGNGYSVEVPYVSPQYVSPNNNKTNESFRNTQSAKDQSFWEGKIDNRAEGLQYNRQQWDVTGNTITDFKKQGGASFLDMNSLGKLHRGSGYEEWEFDSKTWTNTKGKVFLNESNNIVTYADYEAARGAYSGKVDNSSPMQRHDVVLNNGNGRIQTTHTYPTQPHPREPYSGRTAEVTPLERHNVRLENGKGDFQTYHTYPVDERGKYEQAKDKMKKEWQELENKSKGAGWVNHDIEKILEANGISSSKLKTKKLDVTTININRTLGFTDIAGFGKQYLFFSKPDLNLFIDNADTVNPSIERNCPDLAAKIKSNKLIAQCLQSSFNGPNTDGMSGLITILTNHANSCDWPTMGLSMIEGPKNMKGQGVKYGGDFFEATDQGELDISFVDNRDRDVQTLLEIWMEYIEGVNNGSIIKKSKYISDNTLDYGINVWSMTLDEAYGLMAFGMAGVVFPIAGNSEIISYKGVPLRAAEIAGPTSYKFHVSYFHKNNQQRSIDLFNYCTGFSRIIAPHIDKEKGPYWYMYQQVNGFWLHAGFIPYHTTVVKGYEYHFNIEDKMAEMVGVSWTQTSSSKTQHVLVFASRDVGPERRPGDFAQNEYDFYRYDDDIKENMKTYEGWKRDHPNYFLNPINTEITGTRLFSQDGFNMDYDAWMISQGGRSWNDRFGRGYTSANNRYGAFNGGASNSAFTEGLVGQIARAFGKLF